MAKRRIGLFLAISGFSLEQVALGLGILALIAVQDREVGTMLAATTGLLVFAGLGLVTAGSVLFHVGRKGSA